MSWRDRVEEALRGRNTRNDRDTRDAPPPFVASVPTVPASDPKALLREWHTKLEALDPAEAPGGFGAQEWWRLWTDSCWLYETHARYAVLNGWDAHSLFGVWAGRPYLGGLAQQLQSCRSLVFDGPRAAYRLWGVQSKVNAAIGRGLPLVWELAA